MSKGNFFPKELGSPNLVGKFILTFLGLELILGFKGQKVKGQGQGQKETFSSKMLGSPNLVGKFTLTFPGLELILGSKGQG